MEAPMLAVFVASLSFVVASLSLGWNIAQWLLSDGRAKVTLLHGLQTSDGAYIGPVSKNGSGLDLEVLRSQGIHGTDVVGIEVANTGRTGLTVQKIALHPRHGSSVFVPIDQLVGPRLPHRLEPGTNDTWLIPTDIAQQLVRVSQTALNEPVSGVYMTTTTATGKKRKTRSTLKI
ncbi:hypothetical protein [Micrococcus luteus]|uniref:hypothetical protein n=1 Tax=Micrococcus luteus TaxID=1270 RepID=UPI00080BB0C7|nr:hypothetical protein [Micrococcus luteus]